MNSSIRTCTMCRVSRPTLNSRTSARAPNLAQKLTSCSKRSSRHSKQRSLLSFWRMTCFQWSRIYRHLLVGPIQPLQKAVNSTVAWQTLDVFVTWSQCFSNATWFLNSATSCLKLLLTNLRSKQKNGKTEESIWTTCCTNSSASLAT